ncbi:hypothetical protein [Denitromonas sp.]|uniref:hypothetical protein n=1 Tax=Denitromonas sp. TaxID=2734609 RepID=UPI002AFFF6B2|nr:hypothetical protein [Denitromonas sp.]
MAINITVTDGHSPTREPHLKRNSGITVTNSALVPMDEWLQSFERNCEIASSKRGRAHKAKRETANGEIERIAAELSEARDDYDAHIAESDEIAEYTAAAQAAIDVELDPLQAECLRRAEAHDFGDTASRLRNRREELLRQRGMIGRPLHDYKRKNNGYADRLRDRVSSLKHRLGVAKQEAALAATTDDQLIAKIGEAAGTWQVFEWEVIDAEEKILDCQEKIEQAQADIANIAPAESALSEATAKREAVRGEAYIRGQEPNKRQLAALDQKITDAEQRLAEARQRAADAKAAIPLLEKEIKERERRGERSKENRRLAKAKVDGVAGQFAQRLIAAADADHDKRRKEIDAAKANHFRNWQQTESAEL